MIPDDERIALFLDYENLAIGAREGLRGHKFDLRPIADALAARGRVVVRRAYADWSYFSDDRRMLTHNHVELIEIPQRMGAVRKNAADIKMAVDAIELSFEREYITTFAICTGDSDFTPLVHKLRELNKKVIGIGLKSSTSALLPPACDEFLFYERLEGVDLSAPASKTGGGSGGASGGSGDRSDTSETASDKPKTRSRRSPPKKAAVAGPDAGTDGTGADDGMPSDGEAPTSGVRVGAASDTEIAKLVTQTLTGIKRSVDGPVSASVLKRTLLRKDPTFDESDHGFRVFGELLRHLEEHKVISLRPGSAQGDPEVDFPEQTGEEEMAFRLLRDVVLEQQRRDGPPLLSGLKNKLRKRQPDFTEKRFGYAGFLQFCTAARARGFVDMDWDDEADDYFIEASGNVAEPSPIAATTPTAPTAPATPTAPAAAAAAAASTPEPKAPRTSTRAPRRRTAPRP